MLKKLIAASSIAVAFMMPSSAVMAGDIDPHMFKQMSALIDQNMHMLEQQKKMLAAMQSGKKMPEKDMKIMSEAMEMSKKASAMIDDAFNGYIN